MHGYQLMQAIADRSGGRWTPSPGAIYPTINQLEDEGLVCGGTSPDERLVEMVELPDHPFFVASQYHPEFNSRPNRPEPLFREFVGAAARAAGTRPVAEVEPAEESTSDVAVRQSG